MPLSDDEVHRWLNRYKSGWIGLHFDDPRDGQSTYFELSGDSYSRQSAAFTDPANRTIWLDNQVKWTGLPDTDVTWLAGWSARYNGNLLWVTQAPPTEGATARGGRYSLERYSVALSVN